MNILINFTDVHKNFNIKRKKIKAVKGINFKINEGEFVGYLGPNGAGKTTTMKLLTGIISPCEGQITVFGLNPFRYRKKLSYNIGVMFGNRSSLWHELTILDTLILLSKVYRIPKKDFILQRDFLIEELELRNIINKPVRTLSLGQRILGEFAVTLIHSPKLIILDEPTIGLDILVKDRIGSFLTKLNRAENVTIIMSSHDLNEIEKLCDKLLVINSGKIIFDDKKDELIRTTKDKLEIKIQHELHKSEFKLMGAELIDSTDCSKSILIDLNEISLNNAINELNNNLVIKNIDVDKPSLSEIIIRFLKNWECTEK